MTKLLRNHDFHLRSDGRMVPDQRVGERRTLVRRRAPHESAGVLRGEISPFMGEVVEVKESITITIDEVETYDTPCEGCGRMVGHDEDCPELAAYMIYIEPDDGS